jgi:hypothetical protein
LNLRGREVARAGLERCILIAVFEACEEPSFVLSDWTTQGCAVLFSVKWWRGKGTVECRRQSLQIAIALVRRLGKHGSLINRQFGAGVRLAGVTTDMPLVATAPDRLVRTNSVQPVRFCTRACPPGAIVENKQLVRGVERWLCGLRVSMDAATRAT